MISTTRMRGHYQLIHRGPDGDIKNVRVQDNLVVDAGFAAIASRINGHGSAAQFAYPAVGTGGGTGELPGDIILVAEIGDSGLARNDGAAATLTRDATGGVTNDTAKFDKTWSVTGTKLVSEAGIFNATPSGGTLLARSTFGDVQVDNNDTLQIIYKVTAS